MEISLHWISWFFTLPQHENRGKHFERMLLTSVSLLQFGQTLWSFTAAERIYQACVGIKAKTCQMIHFFSWKLITHQHGHTTPVQWNIVLNDSKLPLYQVTMELQHQLSLFYINKKKTICSKLMHITIKMRRWVVDNHFWSSPCPKGKAKEHQVDWFFFLFKTTKIKRH